MGTQGTGRKRSTKKERSNAEDEALNLIAREAEARLAAKRAARAEAREIRMKELERQQKEKYYGLNPKLDERVDSKWGDIEQWMEDSEKYSRSSRTRTLSDDEERMSVGSCGSVRSSSTHKKSKKKKKHKHKDRDKNSCEDDYSVMSSRSSRLSDDSRLSRISRSDLLPASYSSSDLYSFNGLSSSRTSGAAFNGHQPLELASYRSSSSRASSRASSARTSPVDSSGIVASFLRSTVGSGGGLHADLDSFTIPDFPNEEEREYLEKGSRAPSVLTAGTLTSLGGTSLRRGSGDTTLTVDAESSIREIKEIHELKDQIQDVEAKYMQNLKEVKEALAEAEDKYRKTMVSNAQLDNDKNNLMYQVDALKDSLMELEEQLSESQRQYEEKVKECEREKHAHSVLLFQFNEMKETLKQSEELLNEIRQMRIKQEGFVREISDLQETVDWKDKKIGALERQKEYTDAIRIERDELREEVVKLKDILKKHGIILGPDLNLNGDVGEAEPDKTSASDPTSHPAQDSNAPPPEGNSMLGNTEENELRGCREEEVDPEQLQAMLDRDKDIHVNSDTHCVVTDTCGENQIPEEEETCLSHKEDSSGDSGLSKDLTVDGTVCPTTETNALTISPDLQGIQKDCVDSAPQAEMLSEVCSELVDTQSCNVGIHAHNMRENILEERENGHEDLEQRSWRNAESCQVILPDKSVVSASNTESEQNPNNAEDKDEEEEIPSKSQAPASSGKKKKKKRKGKKKGGVQDNENQQKAGPVKENRQTEKDLPSKVTECATDGSVTESLKSKSHQIKDQQEPEKEQVENTVEPAENRSHKEAHQEPSMTHASNEHEKQRNVDTKMLKNMETVVSTETLNVIGVDRVQDEQNNEEVMERENTKSVDAEEPSENVFQPLSESTTTDSSMNKQEETTDSTTNKQEETTDSTTNKQEETTDSTTNKQEETTDSSTNKQEETTDSSMNKQDETTDSTTNKQDETTDSSTNKQEETTDSSTNKQEETTDSTTNKQEETTDSSMNKQDETTDSTTNKQETTDSTLNKQEKTDSTLNKQEKTDSTLNKQEKTDSTTNKQDDSQTVETQKVEAEGGSSCPDSESVDERKSEHTTNNEKCCKEHAGVESNVPDAAAKKLKSTNDTERKDGISDLLTSTDNPTDAAETLKTSDGFEGPEEAAETEGLSPHRHNNMEAEQNGSGMEKLTGDTREPGVVSGLDQPLHQSGGDYGADTADSQEGMENTAIHHMDLSASNTETEAEENAGTCPEAPQMELHKSSKDDFEGSDSSQNIQLDNNGEEEEEEEGQSFDFDDMDVETSQESSHSVSPKEEFKGGAEVVTHEIICGDSELTPNQTEPKQDSHDKRAENNDRVMDEADLVGELGGEQDAAPHQNQDSLLREEVETGKSDEPKHISVPGKVISAGDPVVVADDVKKTGLGEGSALPKAAEQLVNTRAVTQAEKDAKKSKKSKGKGKEDCKMS